MRQPLVQDVAFEDNVVFGTPAGDQAVAIASDGKGDAVYARPQIRVWQWPGGPATLTQPPIATQSFLSGEVAPVIAALETARKVCAHVHAA